jgi:hypothetical protein
MSGEHLKNRVRKKLKVSAEEFAAIWSKLEDERWLSNHDRGEVTEEDILDEAKKYADVLCKVRRLWREGVRHLPPERPDRVIPEEVSVELDGYTRKRAETASEVAATFADKHPEVRRFRRAYLGGEDVRLTEEQAQEFLDHPPTGEILDELLSLARKLGWRYRWTYRDTWWFLLTGNVPHIVPLRIHYNYVRDEQNSPEPHYPNMAEITLIVEPWIDAKDVERVYRDVQRQVLGGDNRKKDERTIEAVRFVARQIRLHGGLSWLEMKERWNRSQTDPDWRYSSRGGLHQAFKRFVRAVYHPLVYEAPVPKPSNSSTPPRVDL